MEFILPIAVSILVPALDMQEFVDGIKEGIYMQTRSKIVWSVYLSGNQYLVIHKGSLIP